MVQYKASFGVFRNDSEVDAAVKALRDAGFRNSYISILHPDKKGDQDFPSVQKSEVKRGAVIGGLTGMGVGVVASLLFSVGIFATPLNYNISFWAGTISLMMIVVLAGLVGAAIGSLVGIGTPDPAWKRYGQYLNSGGILVSVYGDTPQKIVQAQEILTGSGAEEVHLIEEDQGWTGAIAEKDKQAEEDKIFERRRYR